MPRDQFELWIMHSGDQEVGPFISVDELRYNIKKFDGLNIDITIQYGRFSKTFTLDEAQHFLAFLLE